MHEQLQRIIAQSAKDAKYTTDLLSLCKTLHYVKQMHITINK